MSDTIQIEINGVLVTIPAPIVPVYVSGGNLQILQMLKNPPA